MVEGKRVEDFCRTLEFKTLIERCKKTVRGAHTITQPAPEVIQKTSFIGSISGWEWFLFRIWSGILLFFVLNYIFERRLNK